MILLVDTRNLGYMAAFGGATDPPGVAVSILSKVGMALPLVSRVVFCFDSKVSRRKEQFSDYKAHRHSTPEAAEARGRVNGAVAWMALKLLPAAGIAGVYSPGFEADDIMAALCVNQPSLLMTNDADMYQCLSATVSVLNPLTQSVYTVADFITEYRVRPPQWPMVKALAGCKSDALPGIPGVGTRTAVKYLLGELKPGRKMDSINALSSRVVMRNLPLVSLPHQDLPPIALPADKPSWDGFISALEKAGLQDAVTGLPAWRTLLTGHSARIENQKQRMKRYA